MAQFASSVSVEESLEKVVEFTDNDDNVRAFVAALEGVEAVGQVTDWHRRGDRHRHRVEWNADDWHGWIEVNREGHVASISATVHTDRGAGMDQRLDAALLGLKQSIEAADADDVRLAEASPSFVVETLLKGLIRAIPATQRSAMKPYLERAGQLDGSEALEQQRARLCVKWASELARRGKAGVSRLVAEVVERVDRAGAKVDAGLVEAERVSDAALAGAERFDPDRIGVGVVPPGFHGLLNQVYEALDEANKVASRHGWDAVPWTALLDLVFDGGSSS